MTTPTTSPTEDLSALAWVHDELRRSLETASKSLRRHLREAAAAEGSDLDAADPAVLRTARAQLHQGAGALELIGMPVVARVLHAGEAVVRRFIAKPRMVDEAGVDTVERLCFAVLDYVQRQLAGKPIPTLALYPQYAAAQALAGAERVHPADLWSEVFQWHGMPDDATAQPLAADDQARGTMESLVLPLLRQDDAGLQHAMSDVCAGLGASARGDMATLWKLAAAVYQAQSAGLLRSDVHTKRLASRLLAQLRHAVRGEHEASPRLAQDLLFFCARAGRPQADHQAPRLAAVHHAWSLQDGAATVDYDTARLGLHDPAQVSQARRRVSGAKDVWSALAGNESHRLGSLNEAFSLLGESVEALFPGGAVLAQALRSAAAKVTAAQDAPPPDLAMEVATSLLYLDAALEEGELDHPELPARVRRLAERIKGVATGGAPETLEGWMEELYRRSSDRQTMGSVVQELRASLSEAEKQIDQYFRNPAQRELLIPVPGQLAAMRGVLSVLGMDQATQALARMRQVVDDLTQTEVDLELVRKAGTFDRLAENLGALSFLIDMISVQPKLAKRLFHFDPDTGALRAVMGQTERPSIFGELDALAGPEASRDEAGTQAEPAGPTPAAAPKPAPATGLEDDAEMREIFLEEAQEVLGDAAQALAELRHNRGDLNAMTAVRRAFHTLKGSSRMVGLTDFGEAAWACEQLYNARLAETDGVDADVLTFTQEAFDHLGGWVEAIAAGEDRGQRSADVARAADSLRVDRVRLPVGPEAPALAQQVPGIPSEQDLELPVADAVADEAAASLAPDTAPSLVEGLDQAPVPPLPAPELVTAAASEAAPPDTASLGFETEGGALDAPAEPDAGEGAEPVSAAPETDALPSFELDLGALEGEAPAAQDDGGEPTHPAALDHAHAPTEPAPLDELPTLALDDGQEPEGLDFVLDLGQPAETVDSPGLAEPEAAGLGELPELPDLGAALGAQDALDRAAHGSADEAAEDGAAIEAPEVPEVEELDDLGAFGTEADALVDAPDLVLDLADQSEALEAVAEEAVAEEAVAEEAVAEEAVAEEAVAEEAVAEEAVAEEAVAEEAVAEEAVAEEAVAEEAVAEEAVAEEAVAEEAVAEEAVAEEAVAEEAVAEEAVAEEAVAEEAVAEEAVAEEAVAEEAAAAEAASAGVGAVADDGYRVVGPLRIAIPLFNIFLSEADEQSRRLVTEIAEWSLEPEQPVAESTIALAHSLAGNSGTVGFVDLSVLARALEHALMRSQALGPASEGETDLFGEAAAEIRHLLHQFAAGFLLAVKPGLLQRLADHERELAKRPVVDQPDSRFGELEPLAVPSALADLHSLSATDATFEEDLDAVDAIDPDLFPIFDEEAEELVPQLRARLGEWLRHPSQPGAPAACLRTLHTFKGGARLAGAMRVGEMAHRLETAIEHLSSRGDARVDEIEELLGRADTMALALERLRHPADETPALPSATVVTADGGDAGGDAPASVVVSSADADGEVGGDQAQEEAQREATGQEPLLAQTQEGAQPAGEAAREVAATHDAAAAAATPLEAQAPEAGPKPEAARGDAHEQAMDADAVPSGTAPRVALPPIDWSHFVAAPEASLAAREEATGRAGGAQSASVRVRAALLDRLVNETGEVSITRARIEGDARQMQVALGDLTDNLDRLRRQLRDLELQAELQISSRMEAAKAAAESFDPLEMDRFTRFQELTRMIAESVNDVATVQRGLQRSLQSTEDQLAAQARLTRDLQDDLLRTRMVEFESLADRLYRVVRQASKDSGKAVRLDIVGGSIEVDRGVLDRMVAPFEHLLRNAVAHGIEAADARRAAGKDASGQITVSVTHERNEVAITFADDGAGLDLARIRARGLERGLIDPAAVPDDAALMNLIFEPGFSTAESVSELAGRGVGMDVVRAEINAMGGRIEVGSVPARGARIKLVLPLTTAVTQVVMLRFEQQRLAVPSTLVELVRRLKADEVTRCYAEGHLEHEGEVVPFYWLGALLQHDAPPVQTGRSQIVLIVRSAAQRVALHVDEVLGNQEVVVKNLGPQLSRLPGIAGITLLPSGAAALIYNPVALAAVYGVEARHRSLAPLAAPTEPVEAAPAALQPDETAAAALAPLVLVVDDSLTVRRVTQRLLTREGYRVSLAKDGLEAIEKLADERPTVLLTDIEMPRMDGFDLVRNVRADERLAGLPVIMITSRIAQKHREHAAELGVDHYLGKPYPEDELLALVTRYAGAPVVS